MMPSQCRPWWCPLPSQQPAQLCQHRPPQSPSMQIEPRQAEPVQEGPSHPEAQRQEPPQNFEVFESIQASTAAQRLGQISGAAKPGMMESPAAAAGSMQSAGPERHVAVNLRCAWYQYSVT